MVALRATKKVLRLLPKVYTGSEIPPPTNALGDWYVNRLVVDRQPLLLLRLGIAAAIVDTEQEAMGHVIIGPTADRSVVGTMVDFAKSVPWYLEDDNWTEDVTGALRGVESKLGVTPSRLSTRPGEFIWPEELTKELLTALSH